jgi:alkylhydroperoxidase/carboxymuconolactone decarboxylase family protein YurZ
MTKEFDEIKKFAVSTLGEMPEVIKLLDRFDEKAAIEQFNENLNLYLGSKNLPKKIVSLIAFSVAAANGPKESAMIHLSWQRSLVQKIWRLSMPLGQQRCRLCLLRYRQ